MSFLSQIAKITENLYLSSATAISTERLIRHNIKCIINVTLEVPIVMMSDITTVKVQVEDSPNALLAPHFDKCIEMIEKTRKRGGNTLVHCVAGVSRSASVCIAYLMKTHNMTLRQAYQHVKARRTVIRPNVGFFRQLVTYEKRLFGRTSVKMVRSPIGMIPDVYEAQTKNMVYLSSYSASYGRPR